MRILQVVTMFTPDGAYGGPVTVALNQCQILQQSGHEVAILSSYRGYETPPERVQGVATYLFTAHTVTSRLGFAGTISPRAWQWILRHVRTFDVVHVHLARDLVTLPIAWAAQQMGVPVLVQTHGMIDESSRALSRPLDALVTCRTLRAASTVFYLTHAERVSLMNVAGPSLALEWLPNGITVEKGVSTRYDDSSTEVLFLARLHQRKRPLTFIKAAAAVKEQLPDTTFVLVGPDEGEAKRIQNCLRSIEDPESVRWEGPVAPGHSTGRMRRAALYVLPSVNEPFPMTVIEAMATGIPVIVTESCGLAEAVRNSDAGLVIDHKASSLASAILKLMSNAPLRRTMSRNALEAASAFFDITAVGEQLLSHYKKAVKNSNRC